MSQHSFAATDSYQMDTARFNTGRNNKGSPVWADGKLYLSDGNSRLHILKPEATKCTRLYTQFFPAVGGIAAVEVVLLLILAVNVAKPRG